MTRAEVQTFARSFQLNIHQAEYRQGILIAQLEATLVELEFDGSRLQSYQTSWTSGLTKQLSRRKLNLCSGQELVQLNITGGREHAGAVIFVDDKEVGKLSSLGSKSIEVPLGKHKITLSLGHSKWSTELVYTKASYGDDRLRVPKKALSQTSPPSNRN